MKGRRLKTLLPLLLVLAGFSFATSGQTLQTRLEQQTDYVPISESRLEQLIEVAQRFQVPMAIEWLEQLDIKPSPGDVPERNSKTRSVLELIISIVRQSPEHHVVIEDNLAHVFSQSSVAHPFNFLNLNIGNFAAQDESLYGAEHGLCLAINMTLHPPETPLQVISNAEGDAANYPHSD